MKSTIFMAVSEDQCGENVNNKRKCLDNDFDNESDLGNKSKKIFQKTKICEFESNEEMNKKSNNCNGFEENIIEYSNIIFESGLLPFENQIVTVENEVIHLSEINNHWCPMTVELLDLDKNQTSQVQITEIPKHSEDLEDRMDLSWLFDFKLDDLPHLSPEEKKNSNQPTTSLNRTASISEEDEFQDNEDLTENKLSKKEKKPPFTYTELIEYALEDKKELTVSGIYQWISERFPFYKSNDDRWKNSVRHNLSINPHFRKGTKTPQRAGHLWKIANRDSEANYLAWEHKKQRLELFFKMEASKRVEEPSYADESAAATAVLTKQLQDEYQGNLNKSATEILNGVQRNVEVQIISSQDFYTSESGCLNTVSREEIVQELQDCGLRTIGRPENCLNDLFVTTIDPVEFGIIGNNQDCEIFYGDGELLENFNYFSNNINCA